MTNEEIMAAAATAFVEGNEARYRAYGCTLRVLSISPIGSWNEPVGWVDGSGARYGLHGEPQ